MPEREPREPAEPSHVPAAPKELEAIVARIESGQEPLVSFDEVIRQVEAIENAEDGWL